MPAIHNIVITGAGGMLGQDLARSFAGRTLTLLDHAACDVTDVAVTQSKITEARPQVVVHLAAFTKVNDCERNPDVAMRVNAEGTRNVARAAQAAGARLVYMSTDYVFDGRARRPYPETAPTGPLNAYGRSKLAGEQEAAAAPGSLIVRAGWLYGHGGRNFVEAILEQAREGKRPRVIRTQTGTPTWTADLARAIVALVDQGASGLVHVPSGEACTWYDFACGIVAASGLHVKVDPSDDEPSGTPRPAYSVLSDAKLRSLGVTPLPHWRQGLRAYLGLHGGLGLRGHRSHENRT